MERPHEPAAGPVDRSQIWISGRLIAHDVHGDEIADVLQQNGDASAWAIVPRSDSGELRRLAAMLDLDELTVVELLAPGHRIRFVDLGETRVVRLRALRLVDREPNGYDVSLIIADQMLLVLADDPYAAELARMLSAAARRLKGDGAERAAQAVIEHLIGGMADAAAGLEAASDDLAEQLFGGDPLSRSAKLDAFRLRRAVTAVRRVTEPTREVLQNLVDADAGADLSDTEARRWSMIIDHADRVAGTVAVLGDSLTTIFDTSLSLDNARMDEVMKKLTGWAAILAVPTLVTGFVGMNVRFWLDGTTIGFYVYVAIMVVAALILYVIFRRKSWI